MKQRRINFPWVAAAAMLVLLLAAIFWLTTMQEESLSADQMIAQSLDQFKSNLPETFTSLEEYGFADPFAGLKDSLVTALRSIENGNYEEARPLLYDLTQNYPANARAKYFYGLNQLYLGNYSIAAEELGGLYNIDHEDKYDAQYYYAIALLGLRQQETAVKVFKDIATDSSSPNQQLASDYVRMLE